MKPATAVAYRRAVSHRIAGGLWQVLSTTPPSLLETNLSGLDYGSTLRLHRELTIDVAGLRSDCSLAGDVPLLVAASWSSTGTGLRRSLDRVDIPAAEDTCVIELDGQISGGDIAGTLHVETSILVASNQHDGMSLAARQAGSVLLQQRQTVALDAPTSFFPVEVVDFTATFWANREAGWRLAWNTSALDSPFLGSVRLFINAAHPRVVHAVSGEASTNEAAAIRAAIYFDVARSLVLGALASEEFMERNGDYADGCCGRVVYALIQMLFPGDSIAELASAASQRTDHFNSDLQGRLRVFWS